MLDIVDTGIEGRRKEEKEKEKEESAWVERKRLNWKKGRGKKEKEENAKVLKLMAKTLQKQMAERGIS